MFDREKILASFRKALDECGTEASRLRPRAVAIRAYTIYCAGLAPGEKRPAFDTFRRYTTGRLALPEVVALLKEGDVRPLSRTQLDRERLREVFREAVRSLESRIRKGRATPLQIARRAHEIYTKSGETSELRPSFHTFQRLVYGKLADPEIRSFVAEALKKDP